MFGARDVTYTPQLPSDFVTLAEAKAFLGITDASSDTKLAGFITAASQIIEAWCGALFTTRTVTEKVYPENAVNYLMLTHYPIASLVSVHYDAVAQTIGDFQGIVASGTLRRKDGAAFPVGEIQITYTVGAASPVETVKQATLAFVRELHMSAGRDSSIASESIADVGSVTYADTAVKSSAGVSVPQSVAAMLAMYRRTFVL